jgi:hypothetical protein
MESHFFGQYRLPSFYFVKTAAGFPPHSSPLRNVTPDSILAVDLRRSDDSDLISPPFYFPPNLLPNIYIFNLSDRYLRSNDPHYIATLIRLPSSIFPNDFIRRSPPLIILIERFLFAAAPKLHFHLVSYSVRVFLPFSAASTFFLTSPLPSRASEAVYTTSACFLNGLLCFLQDLMVVALCISTVIDM